MKGEIQRYRDALRRIADYYIGDDIGNEEAFACFKAAVRTARRALDPWMADGQSSDDNDSPAPPQEKHP